MATLSRELLLPELMEPGRKPIGPADIDWNNKLSQGLIEWAIFHHDFDILTGSSSTVVTDKGVAEEFDGSTNGRYFNDYYHTSQVSGYVLCRSETAGRYAPWTGPLHRETDFNIAWDTGAASIPHGLVYYKVGGNWPSVDITPLNADTWYGIGVTRSLAGLHAYKDGGLYGEALAGVGNSTLQRTALGVHTIADDQKWDGTISIALVWNRALSATEHRAIHTDPYQILKPAGT